VKIIKNAGGQLFSKTLAGKELILRTGFSCNVMENALPVLWLEGIGVADVLRLIVQPAVRFHSVFISDLSGSIFIPESQTHQTMRKWTTSDDFNPQYNTHSDTHTHTHTLSVSHQSSGLTASGSWILGLSSQSSGLWSSGSSISAGGLTGGVMSFKRLPLFTTVWSIRISKLLSGFNTAGEHIDTHEMANVTSLSLSKTVFS